MLAALLQEPALVAGALALIQAHAEGEQTPTASPEPIGLVRFFLGLLLFLKLYSGAWLFTYCISKDE